MAQVFLPVADGFIPSTAPSYQPSDPGVGSRYTLIDDATLSGTTSADYVISGLSSNVAAGSYIAYRLDVSGGFVDPGTGLGWTVHSLNGKHFHSASQRNLTTEIRLWTASTGGSDLLGASLCFTGSTTGVTEFNVSLTETQANILRTHLATPGNQIWIRFNYNQTAAGGATTSNGRFERFAIQAPDATVAHETFPADTATLADATAKDVTTQQADTASLADAQAKQVGQATADSTSVADAITSQPGKNVADTATTSDAQIKDVTKAVADTATVADAQAKQVTTQQADTASAADAASTSRPRTSAPALQTPRAPRTPWASTSTRRSRTRSRSATTSRRWSAEASTTTSRWTTRPP
jgi:hypothetical protein